MMKKGFFSLSRISIRQMRRIRILLTAAAAFAALCVLAVLIILTVKYMGRMPGSGAAEIETTTQELTTAEEAPALSGEADFLLLCTGQAGVSYTALLDVKLDETLCTVTALDMDSLCTLDGRTRSLREHYASGGAEQLRLAIEKGAGISPDRYISVSEQNFMKIIRMFGEVDVYIEEDIEYTSDSVSLRLEKGLNKLSYVNLLDYMKYGASGDELLRLQAETLCCIFSAYFNEENFNNADALFETLINLAGSDISARDYMDSKTAISALIEAEAEFVSGGIQKWQYN